MRRGSQRTPMDAKQRRAAHLDAKNSYAVPVDHSRLIWL